MPREKLTISTALEEVQAVLAHQRVVARHLRRREWVDDLVEPLPRELPFRMDDEAIGHDEPGQVLIDLCRLGVSDGAANVERKKAAERKTTAIRELDRMDTFLNEAGRASQVQLQMMREDQGGQAELAGTSPRGSTIAPTRSVADDEFSAAAQGLHVFVEGNSTSPV